MKVLKILNLCFLCMAVSIATTKAENETTTIPTVSQANNETSTESTIQKTLEGEQRRLFRSPGGESFFDPTGFHYNGKFSDFPDDVVEPNTILVSHPTEITFDKVFKLKTTQKSPAHLWDSQIPAEDLENMLNPIHESDSPSSLGNIDVSILSPEEKESIKLLYSTEMPPIKSLTPCDNSNALTNILNNLLGILLSQMGEAPTDVNFVLDSLNTSIESNPQGLFDTKLYPILKTLQEKTSPGALNLQNRLKRDLKSKIIFKKEIPRINEPDCKTAFLKLMALAYKSYIEASKLPDCKIKNHILPDNPFNPNKIIIPSFDAAMTNDQLQSKSVNEHVDKNLSPLRESVDSKGIRYNIRGNSETITHKSITNSLAKNDAVNTGEGDKFIKSLVASLLKSNTNQSPDLQLPSLPKHQNLKEQIDNELSSLLTHTTTKPVSMISSSKPDTSLFGSSSYLHEYFPLKLSQNKDSRTSLKSESFSNFLRSSLNQKDLKNPALRSGPGSKKLESPSLQFELFNSATPKNKVTDFKSDFLRTLKDALHKVDRNVESSTVTNSISKEIFSLQAFPQNMTKSQSKNNDVFWWKKAQNSITPTDVLENKLLENTRSQHKNNDLFRLEKAQNFITLTKVLENKLLENTKTVITQKPYSSPSDQHHFNLRSSNDHVPELKLSAVKSTPTSGGLQNAVKETGHPIDWMRFLKNEGPGKSANNNSDTEKPQIRNNRSVTLRNNAQDVNFINNQLSEALRNLLPRDESYFHEEAFDSSAKEPISTNHDANAIFNNPRYQSLSPRAKIAVIKDLLTQHGKNKDLKHEGNLGLLAFWHTKPNNSKIPQIIQKNNINIYVTPNKNILTPINSLERLENPQYLQLLQSILAYLKQLVDKQDHNDENTELLNNIHSMVTQLVTNPELRQNIVVLLRVYVNWASQLGVDWTMGKNINQLLDFIKTHLINGNAINDRSPDQDSESVLNVIIQYLMDAIRKFLPDPRDQEIAMNQLNHAIMYAKEHDVDLTVPENLNELLSYLKEIITRIQHPKTPEDEPNIVPPTENSLDLSILTDIAHMLKDLHLSPEQRIYVMRKVRNYMNLAAEEGRDLATPENWKQLVIFVKTVVESISSEIPVTEPSFPISDDYPDDLMPTSPTHSISSTVLENLHNFIENSLSNLKQREEVLKLLENYLDTAENNGIDLNTPENLNNLIVYLNSIILQIGKPDKESAPSEHAVNPAVVKYISQLIYSLVPDPDKRQTVIAQAVILIKSYLETGIDLASKANLNKLIWDVVNVIKSVVNGSPDDEPRHPVSEAITNHEIEPEAIEIVYKFKQKLMIKGLQDPAPARPQNSYVKYRVPYGVFTENLRDLLLRTPSLRSDPDHLMKELVETSNITEVSPELQGMPKSNLVKLLTHNGSFVDAKVPNDIRRSNLRSGADIEMAVAFEQRIHDLDAIINNVTSVETVTTTTATNISSEKNDVESTTYFIVHDDNNKTDYDPLRFNSDNPFYKIFNKNNTPEVELSKNIVHEGRNTLS